MFLQYRLLFISLSAFCLITLAFGSTLPDDEVQALKDIAKKLRKTNWNFNVDPCSGQEGWADPIANDKFYANAVACRNFSSSNATIWHVVSIILKSQNLSGVLPPEMARLPFLQEIDLTRNYLSGTLPPEWSSLPLVKISLIANRITGPIPEAYAKISTLTSFEVDFNQLSGVLPEKLGTLPNITKISLTSNNFTGGLPATFAKLTTMEDLYTSDCSYSLISVSFIYTSLKLIIFGIVSFYLFISSLIQCSRISDNYFTGQIPNYIENLTELKYLVIQASGLVGPIPSGIASLINLTDLRISDLNGAEQSFPPLGNMKHMEILILRNCNITGDLPEYLGQMTNLKVLDLSFNKLSGAIPSNFTGLSDDAYIYLTGNLLNGTVPPWMLGNKKIKSIDLSYNNLTTGTSEQNCQHGNVNLFASSSEANSSTGIVSCLRTSQCSKTYYSLHINCGGKVIINENTTFEEDTEEVSASNFFLSRSNWAFSSTGHFLDDSNAMDDYIYTNKSILLMNDSQLYMQARLSPISLTYYGFCLGSGKYTINLHFAEIMFTDNQMYSDLGRRIFDVYVQGKLVLKDFNIEDKAGGVGKAIVEKFNVTVTNNTLEIQLYWAGKGTTGVPVKGVYGPLISAISVNPDFIPPSENESNSTISPSENGSSNTISLGTMLGIMAAAASFFITLIVGILWWKGCFRQKNTLEQDLKGRDLHTCSFPFKQIKAATNNFDGANKIGEGGFGPVYKGILADGKVIAIKQLSSTSKQGNREFLNEIGMISALQHPNLVKLYGCCIEGDQLLLIYEYMENNSLARALFGPEKHRLKLDWPTRHKICVGIARGLAYLHEESRLKIVHRDIKATNVLLDKDLNAKISDFGLAKLDEEDSTHISTRIAGTYGYMAPEYAMRGHLTDKADVYSFGIVAFEIVCGRSNSSSRSKEDSFYLLDWANILKRRGNLMEMVDPNLGSNFDEKQVMVVINVALLCTNDSPTIRPSMSSVVSMLEGRADVQNFVQDSKIDDTKSEAIRKYYQFISEDQTVSTNQAHSMSIEGSFSAASTSAADLYPVNLASDYWNGRD